MSRWLKPSLLDLKQPLVLDPHQREVVSTWAIKTALFLELAFAELCGQALAPERHFRRILDRGAPPPGCCVWMFAVSLGQQVGLVRTMLSWTKAATLNVRRPRRILLPGLPAMDEVAEGYIVTFTLGHVGFQVLGWDLDELDLQPRHAAITPPPGIDAALKRLWPPDGRRSFRWPWRLDGGRPGSSPSDGVAAVAANSASLELLATWPLNPHPETLVRVLPASGLP